MRRRHYIALAGTGLAAGLAGCSSSSDNEPQQVENTDSPTDSNQGGGDSTTEEQTEQASQSVTTTLGELVEGDQMSLVVEEFQRGVDLGEYYDPESGNEFALASIALKNISTDHTTVSNLLQTRIQDDEDYQYEQTFAAGDEATFNDGQFAPGEVERGGIPFELPTDASGLQLVFDFDVDLFGGVERATVDLESEASEVHQLEQDLQVDVYSSGDAIEYGDVEVAVNEFRTESSLGQFTEADQGNEYAIVDISITNNTGEDQRFSTVLQMMLKDRDGYTYQEDLMATSQLDRAFDEGTPLSDGETRRGELAYQVEEGLSPLYWVFEFELFTTGDKTFWEVQ